MYRFNRLLTLSAFLLIIFSSCKTTKINKESGILSLTSSDIILINTLPVNGHKAISFYESAREKLIKAGVKEVIYLPEVEFQLLASGIKYDDLKRSPLKESTRIRISETLGVDYIIEAKLTSAQRGSIYGVSQGSSSLNPKDPTSSKAELMFLISNLDNSALDYKFSVTTNISGFYYKEEEDGDKNYLNLSPSEYTVIMQSFTDGIKEISKKVNQ
ncbi:hypothetical protein [Mangrovivirga cuniculi]|uniref:DUF4136 domain-containing protein n=1 Tax=Mangrovivirga cuniculi TaxID=2715131 RepID=A0A4D7JRL3_9BACT|nr:hypothetical protein [Mangrovivirga cuniculi]QCK13555.1 hypothetical protein DCC35_01695 [Mangrovivirga cuniculi]